MSRKNLFGKKLMCGHCSHEWLTISKNAVTSCPKCKWRVRIKPTKQKIIIDLRKFFERVDSLTLTEEEKQKIREKKVQQYNILLQDRLELKKERAIKRQEEKKKLKYRCFSNYSNGTPKCSYPGCTVDDLEVLTIDHINGGGNVDRKLLGGSTGIYRYLIDNDFPEGYRILCFNHNYKEALHKGFLGGRKH